MSLADTLEIVRPSAWAEKCRYLPPSVTSMPGPYRFDLTPYLREIVDCLSVDSPIREVSVQKGVQIGATVGVLENAIGYLIDHVKVAPVMMVTADAELAQSRMESNVTPMLQLSGLEHLIKSADEKNPRKTGRTAKKVEWLGGGYLVPFGAQNANKLRSISIQFLLRDEVDGWPDVVGKDGDPMKLSGDRTAAYESSRKILDISTPLLLGTSKIAKRFQQGDQRRYYVCCLKCSHPQVLRWRHTDPNTGVISGIVWETEHGRLVPDSVRYLCQACQHPHSNDDKTRLLSPDHGAEWRPTATPVSPEHRSYHLSALYSPVGMQTWTTCVAKWLEAWDVERNTPRDVAQLQVFYNNVLGEPFEVKGEKLRFEKVSAHRRVEYRYGEIPNVFALAHCGSRILFLTCAVDVHKESLKVGVFGWARDRRCFLIEYLTLEGPTEHVDGEVWGKLRDIIEDREWVADDGVRYRVELTFIDSGYNTDTVYRFCMDYETGVFPVKGREGTTKNAVLREFTNFTSPLGGRAFLITVDHYKERWASALARSWNGHDHQPETFFNAPVDATDKQIKELTAETKHRKVDKATGQTIGWEWKRPSGAANELWDLVIYANAAMEVMALEHCTTVLGLEHVDWHAFYADVIAQVG
jgi:phage terminase large subunit GpA-like protein